MFDMTHLARPALVAVALTLALGAARADTRTIDVAGAISHDVEGVAANTTLSIFLAPGAHDTAIGWNVALTAYSGSWLTEMKLSLLESTGARGVNLSPGYADNFSGNASYSSLGNVDLVGIANDFYLGSDGLLKLQFFEEINDLAGADGVWNSGLVTVVYSAAAVPEPAPWLSLSAGLLAFAVWGRRRPGGLAGC